MKDVFSVFGNEVRTKLILCISKKEKNVTELIHTCGLSQSAVSQHLSKLKKTGLITTRKKGKEIWYSLRYKKAANISKLLLELKEESQ